MFKELEMIYATWTEAVVYVASAPYFWVSMGMTAATSIFIGALLYNGDLTRLKKGLVTLIGYMSFIAMVDITRVNDALIRSGGIYNYQAFSAIISLLFVSFFYFIGLIIGVCTVKKAKIDQDHLSN